jgi:hypothetical protein
MNTTFGRSFLGALFSATILAPLLLLPSVSRAQTNNSWTFGYYNTNNDAPFPFNTGSGNTGDGFYALLSNTTGTDNTAVVSRIT